MSSSPSRAAAPPPVSPAQTQTIPAPTPAQTTPAKNDPREVLAFPYSEVAVPAGQRNFARAEAAGPGEEESARSALLQAREAGLRQGEREARATFEQQLAQERSAIAKA